MHLEMRVTREGLKVTDLLRPCRGVHSGRYMGSAVSSTDACQGMVRFETRGRACQAAICPGKVQGAYDPGVP